VREALRPSANYPTQNGWGSQNPVAADSFEPIKNASKIHLAIQSRYVVNSNSFAAVRPRMSALSSSLSEAEAKMWSTGWSCHG
jgi:hypothetical protein